MTRNKHHNSFKLFSFTKFMIIEKKRIKIALIAGAAHALRYKKLNPSASDEEVIQYVSREIDKFITKVDTAE